MNGDIILRLRSIHPPSTHVFAQVYSTLMWVPSEDMRLGRVEAGDVGPWWEKEDEEEG